MKLKCLLFGHKKYSPNVLHGHSLLTLKDSLSSDLVSIDICERCGAVFSDLLLTKHNKDCAVTQSETASLKSDKLDEIIHKIDDAGVSTSVGYIKIKESNLRQVLKNYFTKQ